MAYAKCINWFAPNALADEWASKLVLVEKPPHKYGEGKRPYVELENAPCWIYKVRSDADGANAVTRIMTTYSGGCWYGVCRHHCYVYTTIFQERDKGQYHTVSGYHIKAMLVSSHDHAWVEIFIKGMGYYVFDVGAHRKMIPRSYSGNEGEGKVMCNRWITGSEWCGSAPYQSLWAGPEIGEPPTKSYIKATTTPGNARIWLKKR